WTCNGSSPPPPACSPSPSAPSRDCAPGAAGLTSSARSSPVRAAAAGRSPPPPPEPASSLPICGSGCASWRRSPSAWTS
ncbi:MAG: hypothetical protein AVDCRST_MAG39-2467, partial [uncultured Sphingomonadaceae bacterium]